MSQGIGFRRQESSSVDSPSCQINSSFIISSLIEGCYEVTVMELLSLRSYPLIIEKTEHN